ncbi:MAG: hypothetical protein AAGI91_13935 [Bacteroidota bacterium]
MRTATAFAVLATFLLASAAFAQVTNIGTLGFPGTEPRPLSGKFASDVALVVNYPAPSDVNPSFLGPVLLMKSARVDVETGEVTLPLRQGRMRSGESVWYVVTDVSDLGLAQLLGVNHSPKLNYADFNNGVREATIESDGTIVFERGNADFAPEWSITPGDAPDFFPPKAFQPGSVGDAFYTPIFKTTNGGSTAIYNAPVVAQGPAAEDLDRMCDGNPDYDLVHDKVVRICPRDGSVTLQGTLGYSFAKPVIYVSLDSNNELAATLEKATLTPVYDDLGIELEDAAIGSGVERLLVFTNGALESGHVNRQGLASAIATGRDPINVFGGIPSINLDYSPLWDLMLLTWSEEAVEQGLDTRIIDAFQALQFEEQGFITAPDGAPVSSTGIIVNCPIVMRLN